MIELSLEKQFQLIKFEQKVDNLNDVDTLKSLLKELYHLSLSEKEMFALLIRNNPDDFDAS